MGHGDRGYKVISVQKISYDEAHPWILHKHYAKRIPNIQYAYGLFEDRVLVGVVTFGVSASNTLCGGLCGDEFKHQVLELNRLCVESDIKNSASILVARSMKLLPTETIVVSYADTSMGHIGYVYQATNFIYTGLSAKRTDRYDPVRPNRHPRTVGRKYASSLSMNYNDLPIRERPRKHRYVYFIGPTRWKKKMRKKLNYKEQPYPKGDTSRYDDTYQPKVQMVMF